MFRISVTLPPMVALVHFLQYIISPQMTRVISSVSRPVRILNTIYGIWNLDFFRTVIPPEVICLEMSTIHVLALDYLLAFYPLVLIVITYNYMLETSGLSSGCGNLCNTASLIGIKKQWNFKSSIIEAFASFFTAIFWLVVEYII